MADPLSIAASVAGFISLGLEVTKSLVDFYKTQKGRDTELAGLVGRLEDLTETFQILDKILSDRVFQASERSLLEKIEISIGACDESIQELREECEKFNKTSSTGVRAALKVVARKATYPFRQSTLQKLDEDIVEIRDNLSFTLDILQFEKTQRLQEDFTDIKALLELVRASQISSDLDKWLSPPDAFVNHQKACMQKHPGTGIWLTKGSEFLEWLTKANSFIWLNGFAGTGKSVLCSTAIQSTLRYRGGDRGIGIIFFYFAFDDDSKQDESAMIRALLMQLSNQLQDDHTDLARLYNSHRSGLPPPPLLLDYLRRLIQRFRQVYIFLDALDESPSTGPRQRVLNTLETIQQWDQGNLHMFVTSRNMPDIHDLLKSLITQEIPMRNTGVERDIADFIAGRLREDRRLRKLLPHSEKIEKRLSRDANGVFRWVECQLKSLQSCPRSEYHVDQFLDSLPQGLDETYKRMLCNIEDTLLEDARRIFTLLCFTPRPLSVPELLDGIAVDIKEPKGLNRKRRLQDFDDICDICPGFIEVTNDFNNFGYYREGTRQTVRIAHFSIQEYLESERIQGHKAANYSLNKVAARTEIAEVCLLYLLEEDFYNSVLNRSVFGALPLVEFAAKSWYPCYKDAVVPATRLESLILILFQRPSSFANWAKLHVSLPAIDGFFVPNPILSPIEYAASLGLDRVLSKLLKWEEVNTRSLSLESTESPSILRLALQQASWNGHESTVKILLDAGAKIYAKGDAIYVTALKDASRHDHERVVRMLIEAGTDVSPQNGKFGNELRKASEEGELEVVRALIEAGADINFRSETFGTALTAASYRGHKQVVQTLMKAGADVELQGKFFGSALQIASRFGRKEVVQVLIEAGADLNARNGQSRSALELASDLGHENVVQILKSAGAT